METFETHSEKATIRLGRDLAGKFRPGDCVAIVGPLGAGKTALIRGIALGLGLADEKLVCSPTYVLVREYPCRQRVYHVDLYRLGCPPAELADLGLEEMLSDGLVLMEWADRAGEALPRPRWQIAISPTGPTDRRFEVRRVE